MAEHHKMNKILTWLKKLFSRLFKSKCEIPPQIILQDAGISIRYEGIKWNVLFKSVETDEQRLKQVLIAGELIYCKETNMRYVGDGTTPGGRLLSVS
jgi:hypothetical protein